MDNDPTANDCVTALLLEYQRLLTENFALQAALQSPESERLAAYNLALAENQRTSAAALYALRDYARAGRWKQLLETLEQVQGIEKRQP